MSFVRKEKEGVATIKIEGPISIYEVAALREELLFCLDNCEILNLDLSEATDCDITGLQLIYSALKASAEEDKKFNIFGESSSILDFLTNAGLNPEEIFSRSSD